MTDSASTNKDGLVFVVNSAIDLKSPFYLHPSDHLGLTFVTQSLSKNGDNYFTWRSNFLNALRSKNKARFVDGSIDKPDTNSRDFQAWIQCNALVKSRLWNSISKELQTGATHSITASEIWFDFEERFIQGIAPRVYELKRTITLLQQERSAISTYYGKLKSIWSELQNLRPVPICICRAARKLEAMPEEEKVFNFLMGLDDTHKTVRSQILSLEPLPSLRKAYAIVAHDEKQRNTAAARTPILKAITLLAKSTPQERRGGNLYCSYCNKANHSIDTCYALRGYLSGWRKPQQRSAQQ